MSQLIYHKLKHIIKNLSMINFRMKEKIKIYKKIMISSKK